MEYEELRPKPFMAYVKVETLCCINICQCDINLLTAD